MGAEVMSDAPNKIWLQRPNRDPENEWHGEVTWCEDKQNDDDTCYIKASAKTTDLANQIERLTTELDKARTTIARMNSMESEHCADLAKELAECRKERNAFLAKELEAVAKWPADAIYRYIQQLTDDQFCTKCVRGQCTGDKEGVCCGN